jgi:hypothetical protein
VCPEGNRDEIALQRIVLWQSHLFLHDLKKFGKNKAASIKSKTASIATTAVTAKVSLVKNTNPNETARMASNNCQSLIFVFDWAIMFSRRVMPPNDQLRYRRSLT